MNLFSIFDIQHNPDGTIKGPLDMNNAKITELATPTVGTDAATKSYADSIVGTGGLHAASHTDGTDDIQSATDGQKGVLTASDHTQYTSDTAAIVINAAETTIKYQRAFLLGGM